MRVDRAWRVAGPGEVASSHGRDPQSHKRRCATCGAARERPGISIDSESVSVAIGRLQPNDGAVLVEGTGERLTGWIHVYRSHVLQPEPFAEVGGLVVDPKYRGNGVGHRLLEIAERWADTNGLTVIRLRSSTVRSDAHRFHERRGYGVEKTSYTFVKQASASGSGAAV